MTAESHAPAATGLTLGRRLTLAAAGAALLAALTVGGAALLSQRAELSAAAERRLDAAAEAAARGLERRFAQVAQDLRFLAGSELGAGALAEFAKARADRPEGLRELDAGGDRGLSEAPDGARRSAARARRQGDLAAFAERGGYADLLLISPQGEVTYSSAEGSEPGAATPEGPLAEAVRRAKAAPRGRTVFADRGPGARGEGPAEVLAAIRAAAAGGASGGVIALRLSPATLGAILEGAGAQGAARLALRGAGGRLRAAAGDAAPSDAPAATSGPVVERAVESPGLDWRVEATRPAASPAGGMGPAAGRLALAGLPALAAALALGWLAGRGPAGSVRRLAGAATAVARGRAADMPETGRGDELGALARALAELRDAHAADRRLAEALRAGDGMVMVLDPGMRIVFASPATEAGLSPLLRGLPEVPAGTRTLVGLRARQLHPDEGLFRDAGRGKARSIELGGRRFVRDLRELRDAGGALIGRAATLRDADAEVRTGGAIEAWLDGAARGDFSRPASGRAGEGAMDRLAQASGAFFDELEATADALAAGGLSARMGEGHEGRFGEAARRLNAALARLAETVADIDRAARSMRGAADEISGDAEAMSARAEAQAASLEQTAATMEEMAANVKGTAGNAANAEALAREAASRAESGREVMSDAVSAMGRIEESSERISDIVSVIDGIAFQTNLLALNAAVEAARAGEAGKGFAVVAAEVRDLAQRSRQAARDIADLIRSSAGHVGEGVRLVQGTGAALEEIADGIARTAETIADISGAVQEQASGVQQISQTVSHMDETTQGSSAMAERNAAAARRLQNETRWLIERVGFFDAGATAGDAKVAPGAAAWSGTEPAQRGRRLSPAGSGETGEGGAGGARTDAGGASRMATGAKRRDGGEAAAVEAAGRRDGRDPEGAKTAGRTKGRAADAARAPGSAGAAPPAAGAKDGGKPGAGTAARGTAQAGSRSAGGERGAKPGTGDDTPARAARSGRDGRGVHAGASRAARADGGRGATPAGAESGAGRGPAKPGRDGTTAMPRAAQAAGRAAAGRSAAHRSQGRIAVAPDARGAGGSAGGGRPAAAAPAGSLDDQDWSEF